MSSEERVRMIWCDFGGVLTEPIQVAIDRVVRAVGVPWPVLRTAIDRVAARYGSRGLGPLERGLLTQADWARQVTAVLGPDHVPRIALADWDGYWYQDRELNTALVAELDRVARRGVAVGLLTNSVQEWEPHRERLLRGVDVFSISVRSHELGVAKPDPAIFAHADGLAGPGPALLIDDTADNCAAARTHGWAALHHRDTTATVTALRRAVPPE